MKKHLAIIISTLLAAGFSVFIILDTFVIKDVYKVNTSAAASKLVFASTKKEAAKNGHSLSGNRPDKEKKHSPSANTADNEKKSRKKPSSVRSSKRSSMQGSPSKSSAAEDDGSLTISGGTQTGSYSDDDISVTITQTTVNDTAVYVADVTLSSLEYLKTAFAEDTYGRNITASTSDIAENNNAIFAVNGDYYGSRESGYVIRNGIIYRDESDQDTDILCIYADGRVNIQNTGDVTAKELLDDGVWQVLSFGPALVKDGAVVTQSGQEVGRAMASNPRTAMGITDDGHFIFVVSDGRTDESEGLTVNELANFLSSLGVTTAYNLDGGGSSTMYFKGQVINNPTTTGNSIKERSVSDIVYVGK